MISHPRLALNRRELLRTGAVVAALPISAAANQTGFPNPVARREERRKQGPLRPNKTYRAMEWECHTPPEANFDIDVEAAVQAAADCGAESLMLYAQDHWGYAFYPSDVGVRHPHLNGDFLGREVAAARKHGISAICYYSVRLNHQCVQRHPDWGWVDDKGVQQRARWNLTCVDGPYRRYLLGMINELFERYPFDQLFLDTFGLPFNAYYNTGKEPFCYCPHTVKAWEDEHPGDPYRSGFATRAGWDRRFEWLHRKDLISFLDEITAAARKHHPGVVISLNGGPERFPNELMQRVSFIYAEPITSTTGISLGSILMRGWGRPDYQAGVFSEQGYLDTYPGSIPRVKADALILQNARVFIVGNAPVIGGLDGKGFSKRWFSVAKETWTDVRGVDALLAGVQPVLSTAMLYSEATRVELAGQKRPTDFRASTVGALELLTYTGRPVESLPEFRVSRAHLRHFDTLVLPEVEVIPPALAEMIREWVKEGGTLIASGRCGLINEDHTQRPDFILADVFGASFVSEERKYATDANGKIKNGVISTYLESSGHPLVQQLATSTVGLPGAFLRLRLAGGTELMHYRLPFMVEDLPHEKWFNWGPPPPGGETAGPAVIFHRFGKGQSVYLGVPLFQGMSKRLFWIRRWIPGLIRQLSPLPAVELDTSSLPEHVNASFFRDRDGKAVLVQILNASELLTGGDFMEVPGVRLRINPKKLNVSGARVVWPHERELDIVQQRGQLEITIPSPGRYTALYLSTA